MSSIGVEVSTVSIRSRLNLPTGQTGRTFGKRGRTYICGVQSICASGYCDEGVTVLGSQSMVDGRVYDRVDE